MLKKETATYTALSRIIYRTSALTAPHHHHYRYHYLSTFNSISVSAMAAVHPRPLHSLGPVHPPRVEKSAVKPSIARHVDIRVSDPLDHDAPAILHEPRDYSATESKGAAVVLISGAGGGVSGPAGIFYPYGVPVYPYYGSLYLKRKS